ncbi:NRDE family protein [Polaribacter sp.]|nr:NRDE family protein [Polaribacter sp.]
MCTVTYLPLKNNDFILTSNRDETPLRNTIPPQEYLENGVALTYPKDELAGGTWIGLSAEKRLVCLLNGGFEIHQRKGFYKKSRGIMVKNILSATDSVAFINAFNFIDIEPFTLVLVVWETQLEAFELVWDGTKKHFNKLPQEPRIWSSSTLYTQEMKQVRKEWFAEFLKENTEFSQEEIVQFHKIETLGTPETSLKMKRSFVETVSITSIIKTASAIKMKYIDFVSKSKVVLNKPVVQEF